MFNITFLKTLNILYIESNENTGKHYFNILKKMITNVVFAKSSSEAIEIFNSSKNIDLVICDTQLSDGKGTELLKELRQKNEDLPFILTTKKYETEDLLSAVKLSVDDFLVKPVNAKDLIFTIEKICHNKFQEKLKEQTSKDLSSMIEIINEVALVTKTNTNDEITFVNDGFINISGYEESELLNRKLSNLRDTNYNPKAIEELYQTINNSQSWEGKDKYFTKEKEEFYVHLNVLPILSSNKTIKEFIWIRFLITEYEQEQKTLKKNVAKNIHQNRRVNNDARDKIDELMKKIAYYQNLDNNFLLEQKRNSKFVSQFNYYEKEIVEREKKLKHINEIANKKIKDIVSLEKVNREKKIKVDEELNALISSVSAKNEEIKKLTKDLDKEKARIKELEEKISIIEST